MYRGGRRPKGRMLSLIPIEARPPFCVDLSKLQNTWGSKFSLKNKIKVALMIMLLLQDC